MLYTCCRNRFRSPRFCSEEKVLPVLAFEREKCTPNTHTSTAQQLASPFVCLNRNVADPSNVTLTSPRAAFILTNSAEVPALLSWTRLPQC